jgi:C-terminal processing protease CtpA/Prc
VISPGGEPIDKPVLILMNAKCFSATDVFLSGVKGLPNVTLLGTPTSGGSANVNTVSLGETPIRVRLGTIVSFQSSGKLFDGVGVEPDVLIEPEPDFFIGGRDNQLDGAVSLITK